MSEAAKSQPQNRIVKYLQHGPSPRPNVCVVFVRHADQLHRYRFVRSTFIAAVSTVNYDIAKRVIPFDLGKDIVRMMKFTLEASRT